MNGARILLAAPAGVLACVLALTACGDAQRAAPAATTDTAARTDTAEAAWFEEVAAPAGVRFVHHSGHIEGRFYTPEVTVGGVALLDADEDGALDLYFVQSGSLTSPEAERPGNELYRNRGDGSFEDVSAAGGAADRGYGVGAATGDFDNDGRTDLYVTNVGANRLFRNLGGMRFHELGASAGVDDAGFGSSAAFLDYDADGDLDLYVCNYLVWSTETEMECSNGLGQRDYCAPARYNAPAVDVLYRNEGDGSFHDASREAGIQAAFGTGLGVVCGDFTNDGRIDLFVANDGRRNQLWVNLGEGRFEDRGLLLGCAMDQDAVPKAGMGVAAADFDDDGDLDLLVSNLRRESDSLYKNESGSFVDTTGLAGLGRHSRAFTRFGTGWVDFDNDGRLDLYQACGRVASEADRHAPEDPLAEPNLLFRGLADGTFQELTPRGGCAPELVHTSRGAAFGDLDNDGGMDIVVVNRDAPPYVLRNRATRGHWLLVRVLDEHGRDALGATLTLQSGGRTLRRDVRSAYSYCSASDPRVHFGLGAHAEVESLEVRWIDGTIERVPLAGVDRLVEIRREPARGTEPGR